MYRISFSFIQPGIKPVMLENVEPGQTLLEVALKNDIELHHNCGGVCSCTTCHLFIEKGMEFIDDMSKREKDFVKTVFGHKANSRLGCQSLLLDGEGDVEITVPDQTLLPDEFYGFDF
ncbi:MAG: 2Fe-2S iron-sulfur cluster binding domain-containing protein [Bacteroidetes bacterium]|jgi:2Fe-2S ferredoxin|nr:MAG: 2Fe-2S iron-sulfur cluster binding domain-containing protein [Bacteroidota bacterium]